MDYWKGYMNWPRDPAWKCQTCGGIDLTWGLLVHAECRCDTCHTHYHMRDEHQAVVTVPICVLKPEYIEPAKTAWQRWHAPLDELSDEQWDLLFAEPAKLSIESVPEPAR